MIMQPRIPDETVRTAALAEGYTPLQADLISRRVAQDTVFAHGSVREVVHPALRCIPSPSGFAGIERAVGRILQAIDSGEVIGLCCDHDADGQTSLSVMYLALTQTFGVSPKKVVPMCSHRLTEGYGVSDAFVDRLLALETRPTLVLTADQGSSDGPRVTRLKAAGIDTITSDHHAVPNDGLPRDAVANITPLHPDGSFPDRHIAGCAVAWLLMQAVRLKLVQLARLDATKSSLVPLLDFVAVGTCADAVSLSKSPANRAIITAGLKQINGNARPAWRALRALVNKGAEEVPVTAETISFGFAPRVNAGGRMDDAMAGVRLLLASTDERATHFAALLDQDNQARRETERGMRDQALVMAQTQVDAGRSGLTLFFFDGHAGVHGVVSSRVVDATGRPCICLSPKLPYTGVLTGSVRTIPGVDVKQALDQIEREIAPGLQLGYGGHRGAGGTRIPVERLSELEDAWDIAVRAQVGSFPLHPKLMVDGELPAPPSLELVDEIMALDPYAREFDAPVFVADAEILVTQPKGDGTHLAYQLHLVGPGQSAAPIEAMHFGARTLAEVSAPPAVPRHARIAYQLTRKTWKGKTKMQLIVRHVEARPPP